MAEHELLSQETTRELIARFQAGDNEAAETLVQANTALVRSIVKRFLNRSIEYEDLFQIGCMGLLSEGTPYSVTDYNTGVTFRMVCTVGEGHAEAECASSEDTAVYKEAFGGEYNYSKRPVVIAIGSRNIAASLQGQPHGESHA